MGAPKDDQRPTVTLPQGTYIGKTLTDPKHPSPIEAWLGIRYAQPPIGELRFARPVALEPSTETFEAMEYGHRCPGKQLLQVPGIPEPSEDCLTLNVFRQQQPRQGGGTEGRLLPVMLFLHGGAFNRGTAAMHDTASMLAWSPEPFLAVSCNYRVGALGFLNSSLAAKHGILNLGLHDQRLVMEWVADNAVAFGGDPGNVVLVGLSAGAHSIGHHMMNVNEPRELFHRAVVESGGPTSRVVHPYNSALHERQFAEFLRATGCPVGLVEEEVLPFLRKLPEQTIVRAQAKVFDAYNASVRWAWQPVIDDEIISRRPLDAWKSGRWHKMPLLTGFNHNEGTMYVPKKMERSEEFRGFFADLLPQMTTEELGRLEALYADPAEDSASPYTETRDAKYGLGAQYKRVEAAYGQYAYVAPVRQTAQLGGRDAGQPPIYLYHWRVNSSLVGGANHGDQMWYETMSEKVRKTSPTQDEIARAFHGYVCSFAVSGDPNKIPAASEKKREEWKAFDDQDGNGGKTMVFGEGNDERAGGQSAGIATQCVLDTWAQEETKFWWEQSERFED
ncbi:hypothetical protein B0A50_05324 [Salinomyces thailandicus]|uniref:Carboxylic ester hydrolase n=1 Tax=Salinomyces thailandicus TaxID=706561 RepID=A0A4U0TW36_9PEZI|nr:hypothetical protein B0A50_05324 [Salinomyces thailandica]